MTWAGYTPANNLHPYRNGETRAQATLGPAYESLLAFPFDPPGFDYRVDYEVRPMLAARWEQPDRTTYVFHLRRGVKWHDGAELTARDVVFSYEYARDPKNAFDHSQRLRDADRIEALDEYTLRVTTLRPIATFLQELAELSLYILPQHAFERGDDFTRVVVGTGPYKVDSFDPTRRTVFVRHPEYWQAGKPYPDRLEVIWGLNQSAQVAAFLTGSTDLFTAADKKEFEPVAQARPGLEYFPRYQDTGPGLTFKLDQPPFSDVRVRRALHLAVDRREMNAVASFGEGRINPPGVPAFKTGWAIPQEELLSLPGYRTPKEPDIAEAKRLLAAAGYPNGLKTTVLYPNASQIKSRVAENMSAQLAKIGVELVLDPRDNATNSKRESAGDYEALVAGFGKASLRGDLPNRLHSRSSLNKIGLNDPKLDELLDAIPATPDVDKRKQVVLELQRYLLEQLYFIPSIDLSAYTTWQPWVHGYNPSVHFVVLNVGAETVTSFWLEQDKMPAGRR